MLCIYIHPFVGDMQAMLIALKTGQSSILTTLANHEAKHDTIVSAISEVKELVSQYAKSSFTLKGANLEVRQNVYIYVISCIINRIQFNTEF